MIRRARLVATRRARPCNPRLRPVVSLLGLLLLLAACAPANPPVSSPTTAPPASGTRLAQPSATVKPATGEPIKVGAVIPLTGMVSVPELRDTVVAVFDEVNARGGIGGRPLQYIAEDDGSNPDKTAQAGQKLVLQDNVVAMVGGASLFECGVNSKLYQDNGVLALKSLAVEPACFDTPNIAPLSGGRATAVQTALAFAFETLQHSRVCMLQYAGAAAITAQDTAAAEAYQTRTGRKLTLNTASLSPTEDPAPFVVQYQQAGCEAVIVVTAPPSAPPLLQAAEAQGFRPDWIDLGSTYSVDFVKAAGPAANGHWYAFSEYYPFTEAAPANADFRRATANVRGSITSPAVGSYLAARIFVDALGAIQGEINRQSVAQALRAVKDYQTPLLGNSWSWGSGSIRSGRFVAVKDGAWSNASDWITLP